MPRCETEWPPIRDEQLRERLRTPTEDLLALLPPFLERIVPLMASILEAPLAERIAQAHGYPWERVDAPAVLRDGVVEPDRPLDPHRRYAVVAIGANGSAQRLATKLVGVPVADARLSPATLADHDVVACPFPTGYGSFAGDLVPSPGTRVRITVLELTAPQVERLTFTEFGYDLGRLTGAVAVTDDGEEHPDPLAYVHRGSYGVDGAPVALAAVPAQDRTLRAMTQPELLEDCGRRLGFDGPPGAAGDALLRAILADPPGFVREHYGPLAAAALHPERPGFVPYPAA